MRVTPLLICLLLGSAALGAAEPPAPRLRVGLVLSGGGARGTAHVGVLKVLDELHVHVDAIAGTSMGAVVGGLYASGMSGAQIEQLFSSLDWQAAFRDRPARADLGFRRKQEEREFLVNLPLGVQGKRLVIPTGLIQGQKLTQLLRRATLPVAGVNDFDQLPTRFRAVATDLETGAAVVMGSGDLTTAMRASMSAPGVLTPVERDGRVLVDGGVAENLPIDVARAMGVDVLIVVDTGFPLRTRDKLTSLASVSNQALAILVRRDTERQLATLGKNDVLLTPALGDLASYDFSAVARALKAGEAVAQAAAGPLSALAARAGNPPQPDAQQPDAKLARTIPTPVIRFVKPEPGSEQYQRQIDEYFKDQVGKPLQPEVLARRIETYYGRGTLETLDYHLATTPDGASGLLFSARRNSWGPNYLRLGLALQDDFAGNSQFNAAARIALTELNAHGAEWIWDLKIGASPRIATEFYQPVGKLGGYFIAPHLQAEAHDVPQLVGTTQVGEFRARSFEYGLDVGRELGNWGELRAGLLDTRGSTRVRLGDFSVPEIGYHTNAAFLRFSYDRLDSSNFPHSGQALTVDWRIEEPGRGAPGSDLVTLDWRAAWSRGRNTALAWISGGSTVGGSDTNVRSYFPLGGFLNLSGLGAQSLAGPYYGVVRAIYYRNVGTGGEGVLNVPAYAGLSLELGNVWSQRSAVSFNSARRDAALFFGADTYIGPAYLAVGYDEGGTTAFYLFLGRSF